eukprot:TRINITY_DN4828_c0_g1_i4.p1 TRINITY_DN4828_c0_g1~~TRINITY_DN4828_c0_g1_i4.p1  ORF type:complete len:264 (-),score=67.11 TRINITY_DN4828_c0_g1_i4:344-1135(-)
MRDENIKFKQKAGLYIVEQGHSTDHVVQRLYELLLLKLTPQEIEEVIGTLNEIGGPIVQKKFEEILTSQDNELRRAVAKVLGHKKWTSLMEVLEKGLNDEDLIFQENSAISLLELGCDKEIVMNKIFQIILSQSTSENLRTRLFELILNLTPTENKLIDKLFDLLASESETVFEAALLILRGERRKLNNLLAGEHKKVVEGRNTLVKLGGENVISRFLDILKDRSKYTGGLWLQSVIAVGELKIMHAKELWSLKIVMNNQNRR